MSCTSAVAAGCPASLTMPVKKAMTASDSHAVACDMAIMHTAPPRALRAIVTFRPIRSASQPPSAAAMRLPTEYAPTAQPACAAVFPFRVMMMVRNGQTKTPKRFTNVAPASTQKDPGKARRL